MYKFKDTSGFGVVIASQLVPLQGSMYHSHIVFKYAKYYDKMDQILERMFEKSVSADSDYRKFLAQAIDLIKDIGLVGIDCEYAFDRLEGMNTGFELSQMVEELEMHLKMARVSRKNCDLKLGLSFK
jgi:hypothetical protein